MADKVMRLDAEAKNYGDILHLPNVSNLTAYDKAQGSEVTLNQVTETDNTVTIDTWKECSFEIEDIVKTQSKYDLNKLGSINSNVNNKPLKLRETLSGDNPQRNPKMGTFNDYNRDSVFFATYGIRDSLNYMATYRT